MQTNSYNISIELIPLNVAIYRVDGDGDFVFVDFNSMAETTENISKELLLGKKVIEVFPGIIEMGLYDVFKRVYESGESESFDIAQYQDERISGWRKNTVSKLDENTIMAVYEDVSTLRELTKSVAMFGDNIIASNSDQNGVITYVSQALCDISGYSPNELLGQPHSILRHPSMKSELFKDLWDTIKSGKTWRGEFQNTKKDGGSYWVRGSISPEFNDDNKIIGYSSVRENITSEKIKEQFLANMSHEIRTPLNAIIGFINILKENETETKKLEYLNTIDSASHSLSNVINDILDFSKIESGKLDIEYIDFAPKYELEITKELYKALCKEKNIELVVSYKNLPDMLIGDILRLKQVISNLLSNSIKFTPEYKSIFFNVEYKNNSLHILVRDEGIGITKEYQKRIFESFSQEDNSTTREYGGTGLGLSISYNLVQLMGGELKVKSELGIGSEFYFDIPAKVSDAKDTKETKIESLDLPGIKLLLVEDDAFNQLLMSEILKVREIEFDIVNDGLEAVNAFKENKYDVILMDENMPNMNGIEATKEILKIEKEKNLLHTPIIALTANALKDDRKKFLEAGMDEYLTKPLKQNTLTQVLKQVLT